MRIGKTDANYRRAEDPARSCGTCSMFLPVQRACTLVRGRIRAEDTCDYWQPRAVAKHLAELPLTDLPHLGAGHVRVVVLDGDGRLLQLQRTDSRTWEVIQGGIEPGETPRQAAERELLEETGFYADALTWRVLYPNCWAVQLPPGVGAPTLSGEHTAFRWATAADGRVWLAREQLYGQVIDAPHRAPADYGPPPRRPLSDAEDAAYHEAGHAVLALLMGVPVRRVTVVARPEADDLGHVEFEPQASASVGHLLGALGGPATSARIGASPVGSRRDREIAKALADALARPGAADELLRTAQDGVREELRDPETWAQIEAVANALLAKRTLSGHQVREIMAEALGGAGP